jgi:hypothetical protein
MKIFGIGLSKTGTTSLASALEILGYRTRDYPGLASYKPGDLSCIDSQVLAQNEALTDTPIPSFYRELDRQYPGSKFILTVRDMDGWLLSCKKQFTPKLAEKQNEAHNLLFMDLYGTTVFDEALFRSGYLQFVEGVRRHFKDRPGDLLVLDVAGGDGWEALCTFLGKPVPEVPFPKANVTRIRWMDLQELVSIAKETGQELLRAHQSIAPVTTECGAPPLLPSLVRKTFNSLRGGRPGALETATASARKVLSRRLGKLNAEIPMISRQAHAAPLSERSQWNHFWIVDPLDGEAGFGTTDGEFTINIALIEDQKPIAGVVHAPLSGTTYYAMVGKGAFKTVGDGAAARLEAAATAPTAPSGAADVEAPSRALTLCRLVETGAGTAIADSMEWHSAAPQALARLIGRRIVAGDGTAELTYNKVDWSNPRVRVA